MNKSVADLLADTGPEKLTDEQMGTLGEAVNRMLDKEEEMVIATNVLKELSAEHRKISELEIPELMDNLGFESITLSTGQKVAVKDSPQCSIPAEVREGAFVWLEDNGHGDIIKIALTSKFGRGERKKADKALKAIQRLGYSASMTESVHAGTLKAWARVEIENGRKLPAEFFKVHIVKVTTVK